MSIIVCKGCLYKSFVAEAQLEAIMNHIQESPGTKAPKGRWKSMLKTMCLDFFGVENGAGWCSAEEDGLGKRKRLWVIRGTSLHLLVAQHWPTCLVLHIGLYSSPKILN